MASSHSTAALQGSLQGLQVLGSKALLPGRLSRLARRGGPSQARDSCARTVLRVEAIAAPEKPGTAVDSEFRAWTSPSAKTVAKRTDLKK